MTTGALRPCYIHCGPHKTGTSTLQNIMNAHPGLLEQRGLYLPALSQKVLPARSHVSLFSEMRHLISGNTIRARHWQALSNILRQSATVRPDMLPVISCEALSLSFMDKNAVSAVTRFFADHGHRVHFIYMLRDHRAWLNSMFVQQTKHFHNTLNFDDYITAALAEPRYDYGCLLANVIGNPQSDLTVLPFEVSVADGLFDSFLRTMGAERCDPASPVSLQHDHPNAGVKTVHVALDVGRHLLAEGINPNDYKILHVTLKRLYIELHWPGTPFCGFDMPQAASLLTKFAQHHDALARRLWNQPWANFMPPDRVFRKQVFDPGLQAAADLAEVEEVAAILKAKADIMHLLAQAQPDTLL